MDTRKLYSFVVLCESDNYAQAADKLFMAQSSLSAQIASLEAEFDTQFIVRNKKSGIELTKNGQHFLTFARSILAQYDSIRKDIMDTSKKTNVQIGIFYSKRMNNWASKIANFNASNEEVNYSLNIMYGKDKSKALLNDELKIGLCRKVPELDDTDLEYRFVFNDKIYFGIPYSNPLAQKEILEKKDLSDQNIIVLSRERSKAAEQSVIWLKENMDITDEKIIRLNALDDISLWLITHNDSVTFLPSDVSPTSVKLMQCSDFEPLQFEYGWYYRKNTPYIDWVLENIR